METYTIKKAYHWTKDKEIEISSDNLLYCEMGTHNGVQCNSNNELIRSKCLQVANLIREIDELNQTT